jgi:hypothetical protein
MENRVGIDAQTGQGSVAKIVDDDVSGGGEIENHLPISRKPEVGGHALLVPIDR